MSDPVPVLCGLVLAAGGGTRFGGPKALAVSADGTPWLTHAVQVLRDAGCRRVIVALGSAATEARALVPNSADTVLVEEWAEGLSATLRQALRAVVGERTDAVLIIPVDTPGMPVTAVRRVIETAARPWSEALVQAVYRGEPGHPVLIGGAHIEAVAASLSGDSGARGYLEAHRALEAECGDLWSGADVDMR